MVLGSSFGIIINFLMSYALLYDIKKLIMMQKLEPRTVNLKPAKIGHVDGVNAFFISLSLNLFLYRVSQNRMKY